MGIAGIISPIPWKKERSYDSGIQAIRNKLN